MYRHRLIRESLHGFVHEKSLLPNLFEEVTTRIDEGKGVDVFFMWTLVR